MAVGSFQGQADEPLRSTWLRSADQILPRLTAAGRERGSIAWTTALFGTYLAEVRFTEDNDIVAVTANQPLAGYVAFTEADDVVAAVGFAVPTSSVTFTEADDIVAASGFSAFHGDVTFTEADDVVAATGTSFINVISPGSIDGFFPIGPNLDTGTIVEEIFPGSIDASSIPVGPLYVDDTSQPIYSTAVYIRLFESDGVTVLDELDHSFNVDWLDEANGTGTGSFALPLEDTATAALCTPGRLVRCYMFGVEAFTWRIDAPPEVDEVKRGEEAEEARRFSGTGWAGLLDNVRVEPAAPVLESGPDLSSPFGGRDRVFSFASPDYPNDTWSHAFEHYAYEDLQPFRFQTVETLENIFDDLPSPVAMPYPNSDIYLFGGAPRVFWIWPGANFFDVGWGFFRGILIDPPVGSTLTVSCSADNLFILYVDGVAVIGEQADTLMWTGYKEVTVQITQSRWYMFGAAVQNVGIPGYASGTPNINPGGWLLASYFAGGQGEPIEPALLSNGNWTAMFSDGAWPGWTSGQIMLQLLYEGSLRNAVNGAIGYTFTAFSDSHGNPWTVLIDGIYSEFVPTFAVRVGSTVLEAFIQLHDEGWTNWHVRPGDVLVDMWSYDAPTLASGVQFEVSTDLVRGNLMDVERAPETLYTNDLLVAYDDGVTKYVRVSDASSIATYGKQEDTWDSGGTSPDDATRLGKVELRKRSFNAEGGAIVAVIEPRDLSEYPYHGFNVLDSVTFPSLGGGTFEAVVHSITVATDGEGNPIITLELNKRWPTPDRDTSRLLRTIGGKSVGSWKGRL